MLPATKPIIAIEAAWLATVTTAYWLGGKAGKTAAASGANSPSGRPSYLTPSSVSTHSPGDALAEGSRPLSSATRGGRGTGSGADRILHLLSGAAGADLERSDFREIAENLSLAEVVEVIGQIAAMPAGPAQRDAYSEVLGRWAQLDAASALEHVGEIDTPGLRRDATVTVLRHWAAVDPSAALAFAASNPNNDLPEGSLDAVFRGIGNTADPTAALSFLATLDGSEHSKQANGAIRDLFERNDAEVIEWARSLPEGELRDRSLLAVVDQWARYDPLAAKAWLEENAGDSNRASALAALGESWAQIDPEAAAAWAMEAGTGDPRRDDKVLERVFRRWMEDDIASAAGYLAQQEPGPELDGALEQYIQRIKNVDPDATMAWAESISDPGRRRSAILHVAKAWRGQDPQAFTSYVASSPELTEQERYKLLGLDKPKENGQGKGKGKDREKKKDRDRAKG
jgi:hypothetical protein